METVRLLPTQRPGIEALTWLKQPLENDAGEGADCIIDARPNLSWVVSSRLQLSLEGNDVES